jgi:phenylacetic acid degradation operon negative regulatory protein
VIASIQKRFEEFRQQPRVQARSLIISVFGDAVLLRGGRVWLGSLVQLLEPLDLNERLIRTSVFRLVKEEWLVAQTVGRRADYVLTGVGRRRFEEAARHIYASRAPAWDHRWRLIFTVGELDTRERERVRSALFWQGFGLLGSDCFVHPGADLSVAFDTLAAEGLTDVIGRLIPMLAADAGAALSASGADLVRRAWNLEPLEQAYGDFVSMYNPILTELRTERAADLAPQDAFLLRTLLIHDYRRLLLRDPELPEVLLGRNWAGQTARALCRDLYRRLLTASESHLDRHLVLADGTLTTASPELVQRFAPDDPLAPS